MSVRLAYRSPPGAAYGFVRSLLDRRPRRMPEGEHVPLIEARCEAAVADILSLSRYREVCGLPDDGLLPVAYPHILVRPVHVDMLLHPSFPVRLPGLVHLSNTIEVVEAIPQTASVAFDCRLDESEITYRGAEFTLRTEASVAGRPAWRETMTFLSPSPRRRGRPPRQEGGEMPPAVGEFEVPADIGRRYARVSGDYNPIHLADLLAKPFGFRGAIAHGMWSLARAQAWLGGSATAGASLDVRFLRPLFLPAEVRMRAGPGPDAGTAFCLVSVDGDKPYLRGTWRPGA